jgi:hypothetical protein
VNRLPNAWWFSLPPEKRKKAEAGWRLRGKGIHIAGFWCISILLLALPAVAQMQVGDNTRMNLSGDLGFNYTGNINQGASGHNLGFVGDANLTGNYYSPNFLNFTLRPFYDRTQSNSVFGALTNTSGVNSNVNFFSGSHFPGSFSYNKNINSTGEFGVPGSEIGLASHGNNQGVGVSWSALLPDWPTLTATYAVGTGTSSIFGLQNQSTQKDRDFSLVSTYQLAGFRLMGGYTNRNVDASYTQLLNGSTEPVQTNTGNNNYQFNAQHSFPMSGSYSVGWNRSDYGYDYHDSNNTHSSGASDTLNGNLNFRPMDKLSLGVSANYNDSLLGSVPTTILNSGAPVTTTSLGTFRGFLVSGDAFYQILQNLSLHGSVNHVEQEFLGKSYGATQFGGSANYNLNHKLLGSLSFSLGLVDTANKQGNTGVSLVGNLNFDRRINGWDLSGNYSYSQNVQTLLLVYTTSSMGWVANARRRVGNRSYFMAGYSGSHSGVTSVAGSMSSAERVSGTFTYHSYSANGFYSKSHGTAAFTPTGLVALPPGLPPILLSPDEVIVYDSRAYGFNVSAMPIRRLSLSGGYADSTGDTVNPALSTFTKNNLINGVMQYRLRKIYLNGGYTRLRQSVGTPGSAPITVTSFYIGISRWFNFF